MTTKTKIITKPRKPTLPEGPPDAPSEYYIVTNNVKNSIVLEYDCGSYDTYNLPLNRILESLPKDCKYEDVNISITCRGEVEYGYYDDCSGEAIIEAINISYLEKKKHPPETYAKLVEAYDKNREDYDRKLVKYTENLNQYNEDMKLFNKIKKEKKQQ